MNLYSCLAQHMAGLIDALPDDCIKEVCSHCDAPSALMLSLVCARLRRLHLLARPRLAPALEDVDLDPSLDPYKFTPALAETLLRLQYVSLLDWAIKERLLSLSIPQPLQPLPRLVYVNRSGPLFAALDGGPQALHYLWSAHNVRLETLLELDLSPVQRRRVVDALCARDGESVFLQTGRLALHEAIAFNDAPFLQRYIEEQKRGGTGHLTYSHASHTEAGLTGNPAIIRLAEETIPVPERVRSQAGFCPVSRGFAMGGHLELLQASGDDRRLPTDATKAGQAEVLLWLVAKGKFNLAQEGPELMWVAGLNCRVNCWLTLQGLGISLGGDPTFIELVALYARSRSSPLILSFILPSVAVESMGSTSISSTRPSNSPCSTIALRLGTTSFPRPSQVDCSSRRPSCSSQLVPR